VAASFPMWVQVFQLALPRQDGNLVATRRGGCKVSHVGASFQLALPRQDEILSPQREVGCEFSHVGASFQLALPRQDGNLVATKRGGEGLFELWVRVFNLHFPDKMKSCRHKRGGVQGFPCGCEFSHVVASFQLALPRQDGNLVATRDTGSHPMPSMPMVSAVSRSVRATRPDRPTRGNDPHRVVIPFRRARGRPSGRRPARSMRPPPRGARRRRRRNRRSGAAMTRRPAARG